jgi:hypothetical protein
MDHKDCNGCGRSRVKLILSCKIKELFGVGAVSSGSIGRAPTLDPCLDVVKERICQGTFEDVTLVMAMLRKGSGSLMLNRDPE